MHGSASIGGNVEREQAGQTFLGFGLQADGSCDLEVGVDASSQTSLGVSSLVQAASIFPSVRETRFIVNSTDLAPALRRESRPLFCGGRGGEGGGAGRRFVFYV